MTALALVLALLVPGLGHAFLGRWRRGAAFFVIVATAFGVGLLLDGRLDTIDPGQPLSILRTLADYGAGVLNVAARAAGLGAGDLRSATFEYGTTYLLTGGLMNLLLVLDVFELARGRKG